jgi:magnesium-protoporphyrin O-methyltransferase
MFGERMVRRSLRQYRRKGLDDGSRWLADHAAPADGESVLEVGGGLGAISLELLHAGAAAATVLELSPAYEPAARELAREQDVADRSRFVLGDLAAEPELAEPADIVVLHRVVCCSPHGPELLAESARHTRRILVFSYPARAPWLRLGGWLLNRAFAAVGREYRFHLHQPRLLLAAAAGAGLRQVEGRSGRVWQLAAFERV